MLRTFCLILLTAFLICKSTGVADFFTAKEKFPVLCDSGTCDNEETEIEKSNDDQLFYIQSIQFDLQFALIPVKSAFFYTANFDNEIYRSLLSPPPEQA